MTRKNLRLICIVYFLISCEEQKVQEKVSSVDTISKKISIEKELISVKSQLTKPYDYNSDSLQKIISVDGNLNEDTLLEKVIVFNTSEVGDFGKKREVHILKRNNNKWLLWKKVKGAVLPDEHGGMMGDPFSGKEIRIERNTIVIGHFGGSREKWHYTHRYRYQSNDFYLIGATVNYGAPCYYFEKLDYNLSTGKVVYEKVIENCEEGIEEMKEKSFFLKREQLPSMNGFYPGEDEVEIPGLNTSMFY